MERVENREGRKGKNILISVVALAVAKVNCSNCYYTTILKITKIQPLF